MTAEVETKQPNKLLRRLLTKNRNHSPSSEVREYIKITKPIKEEAFSTMSYPESDPKMTKIKEPVKSFPGMFRKMKISVLNLGVSEMIFLHIFKNFYKTFKV